jgi:2-polyprenyl-6-hydroxyphenyl methylase/3-demethylubiquinone-9 3-methyltransferase
MTFRWKIAQAAEIRWWQRYLKNKPTTDYAVWKTDYWKKLLAEMGLNDLNIEERNPDTLGTEGGKNSTTQSILDAGCGPAGIFMIFKNQKVDALDPLLDGYEATLPHFKKSNYPKVQFYSQPLESFDKKNAYDAVFCLNAINHVADLSRCFDVLVAATKKGGKLIVSIDAHNFPILKHIFQALPGDILHPHQYDLAEYTAMLTERGCTIEKTILKKHEFIFDYYVLVATKNK